jgi:DNA-binding CsgD family transcriptional regulator
MSLLRLGTGLSGELSGPFGYQMFMVEREAGRLDLVRHVVEENHGSHHAWGLALLSLRAELGQLHAVESLIENVFDQELARPRLTAEWPGMLAMLAEAVIALSDKKLADRLRPLLLEYSGLNLMVGGNTAAFGAADRYIAQIDAVLGLPSAESLFEAALELDARTGATLHEVETLVAYAKFLDYSGDHRRIGRATEFRQRARAIAEDKNLVRQLRRLDESTSLRSDRPAGLTRREITVLRLVAEGLSNKEIAELLFISENTAANHVRSILVKTQAPNRTKAAIFAAQHGILD